MSNENIHNPISQSQFDSAFGGRGMPYRDSALWGLGNSALSSA